MEDMHAVCDDISKEMSEHGLESDERASVFAVRACYIITDRLVCYVNYCMKTNHSITMLIKIERSLQTKRRLREVNASKAGVSACGCGAVISSGALLEP